MEHVADVDEVAEHFHPGFNVREAPEVNDHVVSSQHPLSPQHRPDRVQ